MDEIIHLKEDLRQFKILFTTWFTKNHSCVVLVWEKKLAILMQYKMSLDRTIQYCFVWVDPCIWLTWFDSVLWDTMVRAHPKNKRASKVQLKPFKATNKSQKKSGINKTVPSTSQTTRITRLQQKKNWLKFLWRKTQLGWFEI